LWQITKSTLWKIQKTTVYTTDIENIYIYVIQTCYLSKGIYSSGIKIFNNHLSDIKNTAGNLQEILKLFWLYILSTLCRNIIPDDICGRWLNFYSISIFIQYYTSCFIQLYKFTSCVYINYIYIYIYIIITSWSVVLLHSVQLLLYLLYSWCIMGILDLHVFMPLHYTYYWLFHHPIGLFLTLVRIQWMYINKDKDEKVKQKSIQIRSAYW
jgi:hypothetical protein